MLNVKKVNPRLRCIFHLKYDAQFPPHLFVLGIKTRNKHVLSNKIISVAYKIMQGGGIFVVCNSKIIALFL